MINSDFGIDRTKTLGREPPLHVAKGIRSRSEANKQNRTFLVFTKIYFRDFHGICFPRLFILRISRMIEYIPVHHGGCGLM